MSDGSTIVWLRGGTAPEVRRTTFDVPSDGSSWSALGIGTRITDGWQLSGVAVAPNSFIRARGFVTPSFLGSAGFVETILQPGIQAESLGFSDSHFGFDMSVVPGQSVVVDGSEDLVHWIPLFTNAVGSGTVHFTDTAAGTASARFYRVRTR